MFRVLTVLLAFIGLCISCAPSKPSQSAAPKVVRQSPNFDYVPTSRQTAGSAGITIALVAPKYLKQGAEYSISPFKEMAVSMGNDFEELLTAKGFTIRGPFKSRDEMVFNDKRNSNFIITIEIDWQSQIDRKYKQVASKNWGSIMNPNASLYSYGYTFSGSGTIGGNLIITALSSSYGEKLWKKNIAMDKIPFTYQGAAKWDSPNVSLDQECTQDDVVFNAFLAQLEKFYQSSLDLASRQIDAGEMKLVAEEAKKAEKRN